MRQPLRFLPRSLSRHQPASIWPHDNESSGRRPEPGSSRGSAPSAATMLALGTGALVLIGATVAWALPAGGHVRDVTCGSGANSCEPPLDQATDLGQCRVISRTDAVAEDLVAFSDAVGGGEQLVLGRSIDRNAVITWYLSQQRTAAQTGQDEEQGQISVVRSFADRAGVRSYAHAALHSRGRDELQRLDGTGFASLFADTLDRPGVGAGPSPAKVIISGDGRSSDAEWAGLPRPALPGNGPTSMPMQVAWTYPTAPDQDGATPTSLRTTWEPDWSLARKLGLAASTGSGRILMSLAQDADGTPLQFALELAGELPPQAAPATGLAVPQPLSRKPSGTDGALPGRLVITLDLTRTGMTDLAAVISQKFGGDLFPDDSSSTNGTEPRTDSVETASRNRRAAYASTGGVLRALDSAGAGISVTLHTFRQPDGITAPVALLPGGGLTFDGALPEADYYLTRAVGFVKWQECEK